MEWDLGGLGAADRSMSMTQWPLRMPGSRASRPFAPNSRRLDPSRLTFEQATASVWGEFLHAPGVLERILVGRSGRHDRKDGVRPRVSTSADMLTSCRSFRTGLGVAAHARLASARVGRVTEGH